MASSTGQKNNYSQLLPAHCLSIWKPLEGFDVLAKTWDYKRWDVRVGSEGREVSEDSSLLLSLGKDGKVAMLGVGLLPPVQGNQCW